MTESDQLTRADLAQLSAEQIEEARVNGRLAHLLGAPETDTELVRRAKTEVIGRSDIKALFALGQHDLIEEARATNRINYEEN